MLSSSDVETINIDSENGIMPVLSDCGYYKGLSGLDGDGLKRRGNGQ